MMMVKINYLYHKVHFDLAEDEKQHKVSIFLSYYQISK
jgi:hypothetical protein